MIKRILPIALIILGATMFFISSCCKSNSTIAPPTEITVNVPHSASFYNPNMVAIPIQIFSPYQFFVDTIPTNITFILSANNLKKENVTSFKTEFLRFLIDSPQSQTFKFLDSVIISVSKMDLQNKIVIGTKGSVPDTSRSIDLDLVDVELKEILLEDSFAMIVSGIPHKGDTLYQGTKMRFDANFKVKGHL